MIIHGDCLEEMRKMEPNSISAIVTDPPYGLHFMGKGWDYEVPSKIYWDGCLRVLAPGGFLIAMGGSRTFHRLTCAIEDSGFQIRDCISWIYGSGFPKSHNQIGIHGYGTALKPAWEPCILGMKPCDGTFKQNAENWGQAGINIDGCRVPTVDQLSIGSNSKGLYEGGFGNGLSNAQHPKGRWPANVILDEEAAGMLGEPSRFFYCAKASSSERNEGLESLISKQVHRYGKGIGEGKDPNAPAIDKNIHPCVKPLKLMEYLIKLVMPPKDGILLDPFAGSGTTILAARKLGYTAIGIEKEQQYCEIARSRIAHIRMQE